MTLVAGSLVCVSSTAGDIRPESWEGVYYRDLRVISCLALTVDGGAPPVLAQSREGSAVGHQVHLLAADEHGSPTAVLVRRRQVGGAVVDHYTVEAFDRPFEAALELVVESDFATLSAARHEVARAHADPYVETDGVWHLSKGRYGVRIEVEGPPPVRAGKTLTWRVSASPGEPWSTRVVLRPSDQAAPDGDGPAAAASTLRVATPDLRWHASVDSALHDLSALRVTLPDLGLSYLAAGAPWFMALFGRDSLLTAWSSLLAGPDIALDVLAALARYQGRVSDPKTLEQPGRILHELRTGGSEVFGLPAGEPYYGTADASPLFVMLLDEVRRWGGNDRRVRDLLPAARAAVRWCVEHGDSDGDGFVEYTPDPGGLANQGWKDSGDAMVHADGSLAAGPIALAEVQAYYYAALVAMADLEVAVGEVDRAPALRDRAQRLRDAFRRSFWLPDRGLLAMALDGDKRPLAVASSNPGHCLWTGVLDDDVAAQVAARLAAADLTARWGLRTLGASEVRYNPLSYHLGSIWPHDTAITVAGLARYGHGSQAQGLTEGLLETAGHFDWRLPELLGGLDHDQVPYPVPYPVACSPQAWSAAAPLLLLRSLLGLQPDVPAGRVTVAPLVSEALVLTLTGIPVGAGTLDLRVAGGTVEVLGAPDGLTVTTAGPDHLRRPATATAP